MSLCSIVTREIAQDSLRSSLLVYSAALQALPVPVYVKDLEGRFVVVNRSFVDAFRIPVEEIIGKTMPEIAPEDLVELAHAKDRELLTHPGRQVYEARLRGRGGMRDFVLHRSTLTDPQGTVIGILGVIQDNTERKCTEEALREYGDKYRSVIDNIQDVFYRSDTDERVLMGSPSGVRMFGFESLEQMIGLPLSSFWVHPEERARMRAELRKNGEVRDFEAVLKRADGTTFNAAFTAHYYHNAQGNCLGTEGIVRDITERKRAEEERLALERQLLQAQKLESLGILAGGIAHDFNNLLMAILGNLDLALRDLSLEAPVRVYLREALTAVRQATDLTRQMLAYSGKGRFVVARVDLNQLVRDNVSLFRTAIPKTIAMRLALAPYPVSTDGDPGQLQQVMMNLITNAAEAMAQQTGTITFTTGLADRFAYVEVKDTGCGMDASTQARLFEPFFSTKFTGRGLGMSAVQGIVRGHSGTIEIDTEVNRGTTIRVLFPASQERPEEAAPSPGERPLLDPDALGARSILVAEDEHAVRKVAVSYVSRLGFRALSARDGREALELFRNHADEIACVLLDLTMPLLDGVATFREMKTLRPTIPVVLCSGYDQQNATQNFTSDGLAGFLQKPYRLEDVREAIERVLRGATAPATRR